MAPDYMTVRRAAVEIGVSGQILSKWIACGDIGVLSIVGIEGEKPPYVIEAKTVEEFKKTYRKFARRPK